MNKPTVTLRRTAFLLLALCLATVPTTLGEVAKKNNNNNKEVQPNNLKEGKKVEEEKDNINNRIGMMMW